MRIIFLSFLCLFPFIGSHAQSLGPESWIGIGVTNTGTPPYDLLHFKLVEIKNNGDRYASVINVSVQGDASYFEQQATYQLRVDKYEGTADRFDGIEIRTLSGNPTAAVFYVFNNAVWVRPNYKWGAVYVMSEGSFGTQSPLTGGTWGQTTTAPTGHLAETGTFGLKCDFDNNRIFRLPYIDAIGTLFVNGNVGIGVATAANKLTLPNNEYIGWKNPAGDNENVGIKTNASNDLSMYVGGPDRFYIKGATGNVAIGTTDPGTYKLAVEGTIGARKVKVTQAAWADFVFQPSYKPLSIDSVETYIGKHHHLPGIPSEKEVTENGLDLGDMHKKLLQQVEEQMLYIISLKKEMKEMQEIIATLKKSK